MAASRFGGVRRLPSGRYQARFLGPDGVRRTAPGTFGTKAGAARWLRLVEAEMVKGEWVDPAGGQIELVEYATRWIAERPALRPRTVALYSWLYRKHVNPYLGRLALASISPATIRLWRSELLADGVSESVAAKAYRLLRAVFNTAVSEDRLLQENPCRLRGADRETPAERPVLSIGDVFRLADAMPARFRALVLVCAFCSLRWGEVSALRRCDLAEDLGWLRVAVAHVEVTGRGVLVGPPKSRAGVRTVSIPAAIRPDLARHVAEYVADAPTSLVFSVAAGGPVRRGNFNNLTRWTKTVADLGLPGVHLHDLRHAGNIWAAQSGTSTADLMRRLGHDDVRAALIYQRATTEADRRIGERLSDLVDEHRRETRS